MRQIWAGALAAGVEDELFWELTPIELRALLSELADRVSRFERAAALRAGLVAAAIYNVNRRKGQRAARPSDFIKTPPQDLTPKQIREAFSGWAAAHNAGHRA